MNWIFIEGIGFGNYLSAILGDDFCHGPAVGDGLYSGLILGVLKIGNLTLVGEGTFKLYLIINYITMFAYSKTCQEIL